MRAKPATQIQQALDKKFFLVGGRQMPAASRRTSPEKSDAVRRRNRSGRWHPAIDRDIVRVTSVKLIC